MSCCTGDLDDARLARRARRHSGGDAFGRGPFFLVLLRSAPVNLAPTRGTRGRANRASARQGATAGTAACRSCARGRRAGRDEGCAAFAAGAAEEGRSSCWISSRRSGSERGCEESQQTRLRAAYARQRLTSARFPQGTKKGSGITDNCHCRTSELLIVTAARWKPVPGGACGDPCVARIPQGG